MLQYIVSGEHSSLLALGGILFAFIATVYTTAKLCQYLPKDAGREFAHDGKLSAGKPRGAGIIFVLAFVASAILFVPMKPELVIYLILIVISMLTGFLDDASEKPWGELKKGILDLCVAVLVAMTFLHYNDNTIQLALFHHAMLEIPKAVFAVLIVVLVCPAKRKTKIPSWRVSTMRMETSPFSSLGVKALTAKFRSSTSFKAKRLKSYMKGWWSGSEHH